MGKNVSVFHNVSLQNIDMLFPAESISSLLVSFLFALMFGLDWKIREQAKTQKDLKRDMYFSHLLDVSFSVMDKSSSHCN